MRIFLLLLLFLSSSVVSRDIGQTEITTEEGVEVFQKEKYYLLKKNVKIVSDDFELKADIVKAFFDKDLYDIIKVESSGNVKLISSRGLVSKGKKINFSTKNDDIEVLGENSSLIYKEIDMFSNKMIKINNLNGKFYLEGPGSRLFSKDIKIYGTIIDGKYSNINQINEIERLYVESVAQINIITETSNMFAKKANYNKKDNIIELFDNVKIIRGDETIIGDYAKFNTLTESYKVISNKTKKVKILLDGSDE